MATKLIDYLFFCGIMNSLSANYVLKIFNEFYWYLWEFLYIKMFFLQQTIDKLMKLSTNQEKFAIWETMVSRHIFWEIYLK